jgi:YHS domain-containing protein
VTFVQGPDPYLQDLGITLSCAVDPSRPAVLDAAHRAFVNYEAYYFSDEAAMQKFMAEPYRYTGKVTDPVTRARFVPAAESPTRSYGGRLFYFMSQETVSAFDSNPARYGNPMPGMRAVKPVQG